MPPKKRTRLSSSLEVPAPHSPSSDGMQLDSTTLDASKDEMHDGTPVPESLSHWTTDEEIVLFKGMIRWKPVGMHKHFRMLSLSNYMRSNGFSKHHTRAAGIWEKLNVLYKLATLDEREDALEDLEGDDNDTDDLYVPFKLPEKDYKDLKHAARLDTRRASSPPQLVYNATPSKGRSRQTRQSTAEDANNTNGTYLAMGGRRKLTDSVDASPANPSERERSTRAGNTRSRARGNAKSGVPESGTRGGRRSKRGVQPEQPNTKSKQKAVENEDAEEGSQNQGETDEASEEETSPKPDENDVPNDSEENEDGQETEEEAEDDSKPSKASGRRGSARAAVRTRGSGSARGRAQTNARSRGGGTTRAKGRSGRQKRS